MKKNQYHDESTMLIKPSNEQQTLVTKISVTDDETVVTHSTTGDLNNTTVSTEETELNDDKTSIVNPSIIDSDETIILTDHSESDDDDKTVMMQSVSESDNEATLVSQNQTIDEAYTPCDDETIITQSVSESNNEATLVSQNQTIDEAYTPVIESKITHQIGTQFTDFYTDIAQENSVTLAVGSVLKDRFLLTEVLGSGGMGTVFRATDSRRQEAEDRQSDVAIKVLNDGFKQDRELFIALQREAKKTQQLAHPNIVTVYDFDRDGGNIFIVMEALQGQPLADFIAEHETGISFKEAWPMIKGLSLALGYAHKKNIIHSDFKPGNVFVTDQGEIKVMDFGIASAANRPDQEDQQKTVFDARNLGALTPTYASLEMFLGLPADPRDDIYALGCVCYELLTGTHPFDKLPSKEALNRGKKPQSIRGCGRRQQQAIMHALALEGHKRTASIAEFMDEIEPKSMFPKILTGLAVLAITLSILGYLYFYQEINLIDQQAIVLTEEQKLEVKDLLELAAIHFDVGYITAPSGSNALWAYRKVLKIDPYNKEALLGLKKIADLVAEQATTLYEEGKYNESLAKIEAGLDAIPEHKQLLALKNKILQSGSRSLQ